MPPTLTDETTTEPLHVVIAYDDPPAFHRANELMNRTVGRLHDEFEVRCVPWAFSALESENWRRFACDDVAQAHLVIVSTSATTGLPEGAEAWIRSSCADTRSIPTLFVALLGRPEMPLGVDHPVTEFLRLTVEAAGFTFIAPLQTTACEAVGA